MEKDGNCTVWWFVKENDLIYGTLIGDGDSYANSSMKIKSSKLRGSLFYINKEKCRTNITKKIGTGLRTIVKNYKGVICMSTS